MNKDKLTPQNVKSPLDKLLQLVDEGNPDAILAEENLVSTFNELMKYGLVATEDDKVFLTAKGKLAKEEGVENYLDKLKLELVQEEFNNQPEKAEVIQPPFFTMNRKLWSLGILLFILLAMFFSLLNFSD